MNSCNFIGRLAHNPELIPVDSTHVARFTLAVEDYRRSRDGKKTKRVDYFDFEAWDSGATTICKYCKKGDELAVFTTGRQYKWVEDDGSRNSRIKFRVNKFKLIGTRNKYTEPEATLDESSEETTG